MLDVELWYLFPIGVVIAILAMSSGISGSNFWIPVYTIWMEIDAKVGFWLALLTMFFGFGSGVWKNLCNQTICWYLVRQYLKVCIPASLLGGILSIYMYQTVLLSSFAAFVIGYGSYLIFRFFIPKKDELLNHDRIYWGVGFIAGLLKGLIATGLGKLLFPCYINHQQIRSPADAVGTTVVVVFIVNLVALLSRMSGELTQTLIDNQTYIISIMLWVAPAVLLGGQIGPAIAQKLSKRYLRLYVGVLLILVGGLMYVRVAAIVEAV